MMYATDSAIAARYGVSRTTIWRWVARGEFPPPIKLAPGTTRWRVADIEQFEAEKAGAQNVA
jgi:prophage regulatory protein